MRAPIRRRILKYSGFAAAVVAFLVLGVFSVLRGVKVFADLADVNQRTLSRIRCRHPDGVTTHNWDILCDLTDLVPGPVGGATQVDVPAPLKDPIEDRLGQVRGAMSDLKTTSQDQARDARGRLRKGHTANPLGPGQSARQKRKK